MFELEVGVVVQAVALIMVVVGVVVVVLYPVTARIGDYVPVDFFSIKLVSFRITFYFTERVYGCSW